jgi:hypothetical protein
MKLGDKAAFQQFLETGAPPPKGVEQVARYHVPGSVLGWHVLETNDMTALSEHVNNWGDLIDVESDRRGCPGSRSRSQSVR